MLFTESHQKFISTDTVNALYSHWKLSSHLITPMSISWPLAYTLKLAYPQMPVAHLGTFCFTKDSQWDDVKFIPFFFWCVCEIK